jgi:hypothetical protein
MSKHQPGRPAGASRMPSRKTRGHGCEGLASSCRSGCHCPQAIGAISLSMGQSGQTPRHHALLSRFRHLQICSIVVRLSKEIERADADADRLSQGSCNECMYHLPNCIFSLTHATAEMSCPITSAQACLLADCNYDARLYLAVDDVICYTSCTRIRESLRVPYRLFDKNQ